MMPRPFARMLYRRAPFSAPLIPKPVARRFALTLALCLCVALGGAWVAPRAQAGHAAAPHASARGATYRNPVFSRDFPDPDVLKVGADYYAYGTTPSWEPPDHLFPILYSRDLTHWRYVGDAMTNTPAWGDGDWWAPDVIARGGAYYMYYVGKDTASNLHCVAVATARRPTGPFIPRRVIGCKDTTGFGYIDPAPLIDTDGKAYLYISVDDPHHSISVIPLKSDLLHAAGPRKELFTLSQPWENGPFFSTVEGPFPLKHGKAYDLFYSGNDWKHDYAMGYATSSSPLGPFVKYKGNPILHGTRTVTGPGGGSVVRGPHGGWWLVYHAWSSTAGASDPRAVRNMRVDPLTWTGNTIGVRGPTTTPEPIP